MLLRLQRVARADGALYIAIAEAGAERAHLFQAISKTPSIPARVIAVDASDASTPEQLCRQLLPRQSQRTNAGSTADAVLAMLDAQRQRGGRTMLVVHDAHVLTDESLEFLNHLTQSGGLHALLLSDKQISERARRLRIACRRFEVVDGQAQPEGDEPILIDRLPEPVINDHHQTEPAEESPAPTDLGVTPTTTAVHAPFPYGRLVAVASAALFAGLILGWFGHQRFQGTPEAPGQPAQTRNLSEPYQLIVPPPFIQPRIAILPTTPQPTGNTPAEGVESPLSPEHLTGTAWLLAQNPEHYTVQLLAMGDRAGLQWALDTYGDVPGVHWYRAAMDDGSERFVLLYGLFNSHSKAMQAVSSMPDALHSTSPWVRSIRLLQAQAAVPQD